MAGLSKRTRDAFADNENVEEAGLRRKIMSEILSGTVTYLEGIFGSDTPSKEEGLEEGHIKLYIIMFRAKAH